MSDSDVSAAVRYNVRLFIGALQCIRDLLAVLGVLAVVFLLTLQLSSESSLEFSGRRPNQKLPTAAQANTPAPNGVVVIPLDAR